MDFHSLEKAMYGDVENDEELMAELLALEAEERAAGHIPDTCTDRKRNCSTRHHESAIQGSQRMVSSYGISSVSDEDLSSDGEDIDDPELLAELSDLVGQRGNASPREVGQLASPKPPISSRFSCDTAADMTVLNKLQELKKEYSSALKTAKEKSDGLRIKRYQRGFDKIEELMQKMRAGETIDESDIPISLKAIHSLEPVAAIGGASVICKSEVAPPQSVVLLPEVRENVSEGIGEPSNTAVYQLPIKNLLKGEQLRIELVSRRDSYVRNAKSANAVGDKKAAYEYYVITKQFDEAIKAMNNGEVTECEENELPPMATPYRSVKYGEIPPPPPKTLLEGLQQRMQKYKALCERSKADNDDRKHRMIVRILKQYDDAIKACQANKPVNINELPCPPGYPSLPPSGNVAITTAGGPAAALSRRPLPEVGVFAAAESSVSGRQSRQKQQLDFLLKRQLQFKQAAITAKKKGDVTAAKKFLLTAKVPSPPQVRSSAKLLKPSVEQHFDATIKDASAEIFATMEKDLIYQVKFCEENMRAFTQLSDVSRVKLFEAWSAISKRDLILLRELAKRDAAVPQFRYETRSIPSVEVCLDVDKHNIELTIIKITDAKLPAGWKSSDGYLFVKFDFAFPHDAHQTGRTKVIAATNSPEYNQKFLLTISRKTKQLLRVIKRNCLKFEIYQKGGFLRSDKLIATADCKLSGLEEKVYIRESLNLMEGRKQAGGKLNYQVRIREPLNGKMLSVTQKKWLMLGS